MVFYSTAEYVQRLPTYSVLQKCRKDELKEMLMKSTVYCSTYIDSLLRILPLYRTQITAVVSDFLKRHDVKHYILILRPISIPITIRKEGH